MDSIDQLPFARPGHWYRGNLHTHSTASDGRKTPAEVCAFYRAQGYDFISLTDHFLETYRFPITDTTPYRGAGFTTILGAELHAPATSLGENWHHPGRRAARRLRCHGRGGNRTATGGAGRGGRRLRGRRPSRVVRPDRCRRALGAGGGRHRNRQHRLRGRQRQGGQHRLRRPPAQPGPLLPDQRHRRRPLPPGATRLVPQLG